MIGITTHSDRLARAFFVGAARPHTPRLQSPPQRADANRNTPRYAQQIKLREKTQRNQAGGADHQNIGQRHQLRYSLRYVILLQPGGSILDEHLAQFSMIISIYLQ